MDFFPKCRGPVLACSQQSGGGGGLRVESEDFSDKTASRPRSERRRSERCTHTKQQEPFLSGGDTFRDIWRIRSNGGRNSPLLKCLVRTHNPLVLSISSLTRGLHSNLSSCRDELNHFPSWVDGDALETFSLLWKHKKSEMDNDVLFFAQFLKVLSSKEVFVIVVYVTYSGSDPTGSSKRHRAQCKCLFWFQIRCWCPFSAQCSGCINSKCPSAHLSAHVCWS